MDRKGCIKGKSCGATCIDASERCVLELGPIVNNSVGQVRDKLNQKALWMQVKAGNPPRGAGAKFDKIKKQVEKDVNQGRGLRAQAHLQEFKKRLQEEGLIPASKKSEDAGALFMKQLGGGEKPKSVPPDLKQQLAGLGPPPKETSALKTSDMLDDISRIMRGETPRNLQIASAGDELGVRARVKPTEIRKVERQLESALGLLDKGSMNLDQMREAAAKQANELSLQREKATNGNERKALRDRIGKLEAAIQRADELDATATGNTRWARVDAKDFDGALGSVRREGNSSYDGWKDSYESGAKKIGEGSYGTVIRNKDGTFVKRGDISDTEATLIDRLGKMDLGPKLIAADVNGPPNYHSEKSVEMKNGRIAMTGVAGSPMGSSAKADAQFGGKNAADVYWRALADLHRSGIAHNDAHIDNILVDDKGKGRWVDLGLAQASPKAALAEAMGVFPTLRGAPATRVSGAAGQGNWQSRQWDGTGVKEAQAARDKGGQTWTDFMERFPIASRVWENRPAAQYKMRDMGLTKSDISSIIDHGIRSTPESYNQGAWAKLTDQQAQDIIKILYDGI